MPLTRELAELAGSVVHETDPRRALEVLTQVAVLATNSRLGFVAVLNEEAGYLEIWATYGPLLDEQLVVSTLPVDNSQGIVSYVAATGVPVVTDDVGQEPRYRAFVRETVSELAIPIQDRSRRVQAVLNLESDRTAAYREEEQQLATVVVGLAAMVLEREFQHRREEALLRVAGAIHAATTEETMISSVVRVAEEILRLNACSIFLVDPSQDRFVLRGTSGALRDMVGAIWYERDEGFTGWVCNHREPILQHGPQRDPRWRGKYVEIPSDQVASFLAVPIVWRGQGIGAIRVLRQISENPYLDNRFGPDDQRLLQAIAEQVAIGLDNVRSHESRIRDQRMIAWGELSAKSSHMIGNRVFALKGDLNELGHVLDEDPLPRSMLSELHESLHVNVQRIEEILHDFRDFVSATQIRRGAVEINTLIQETAAEVFPKRVDIFLELELDGTLPRIVGDEGRLRRAFSELIENSVIHTPQGSLRICTERVRGEAGDVDGVHVGEWVRIVLSDTGPGVPREKKVLIFQPFFSGRVRGMGLGLSIVHGIVEAHGGVVYEDGVPGSGARFIILLPIGTNDDPS